MSFVDIRQGAGQSGGFPMSLNLLTWVSPLKLKLNVSRVMTLLSCRRQISISPIYLS